MQTVTLNEVWTAISEIKGMLNSQPTQPELFTAKELEAYLRISAPTRIKLGKDGTLNPISIGGRIYYAKDEVYKLSKGK